jgi:hypothetical protein
MTKAEKANPAARHAIAGHALAVNHCPECGQGVHRNLALTGWVQCDGYGADGFRRNGARPCGWQGFTS